MLRECATIAITSMEGLKSHGTALTISCMLLECAKTVTLTAITERRDNKNLL